MLCRAVSALALGFAYPVLGSTLGRDTGSQQLLGDFLGREVTDSPNILFILTDDQDLHLKSLDYLPLIKKHLIEQGTLYQKHFCTTAICCPSRVSLLTGKLSHNTNVTDVNPPYGGYPKFVNQGFNSNYLPIWLQDAGYNTYYTGKLFNAHTVDNYNKPFPAGWTQSDFLLDPYTYAYLNASYQRNQEPPVSYEGQHTVDVLAAKANALLDQAVKEAKPFFLGIAPIAPHSNVQFEEGLDLVPLLPNSSIGNTKFSPPVPAERHAHLFPDAIVPRTPNFNPEKPSGANWVAQRERLTDENVEFNDHFYRQRLRALQSVDELVEGVVQRLEKHGLLDNTYIIYTSDNGYHVSQHRLNPGKECGFEEDINVPLIIRGPGVPRNKTTDVVTTHVDLAPTILELAGIPPRTDFDGEAVPTTETGIKHAAKSRHEHVTVEFWGIAAFEGGDFDAERIIFNNTYKALRIIGDTYNLYYSVWCTNEHELYDLESDPYQVNNLLAPGAEASSVIGVPLSKLLPRLDSLLFVLKSCKAQTCVRPWEALHPQGNVQNLWDSLSERFDAFYNAQKSVRFSRCELGYIVESEGPQFEVEGVAYREGTSWSDWV